MADKSCVTMRGDTWDAVAYRLWGDERLMDALFRANPEHADVLVFPAGVVLTVPDVEPRLRKEDLPVWMR